MERDDTARKPRRGLRSRLQSANRSLLVPIVRAILYAFLGIAIAASVLEYRAERNEEVRRLVARLQEIESIDSQRLAESLWDVDLERLEIQLEGIVGHPDIAYVKVVTHAGHERSAGSVEGVDGLRQQRFEIFDQRHRERLGHLEVSASLDRIDREQNRRFSRAVSWQLIQLLVFMLIVVLLLISKVRRPLKALRNLVEAPHATGKDALAAVKHFRAGLPGRKDEVYAFAEAYESALEDSWAKHEREIELRRKSEHFVPHELLSDLDAEDVTQAVRGKSTMKRKAVMFADIIGFSNMANRVPLHVIFNLINNYLQRIETAVVHHGGYTLEYRGDGILALFEDADRGFLAAREMLAVIDKDPMLRWKETRTTKDGEVETVKEWQEPIEIRVGLHYGDVALGIIGGKHQLSASVLGDNVNAAARVESLTRDYDARLLLTREMFDALSPKWQKNLRFIEHRKVKGLLMPLDVFDYADWLTPGDRAKFIRAVNDWGADRFERAVPVFRELREAYPLDGAVAYYCRLATKIGQLPDAMEE